MSNILEKIDMYITTYKNPPYGREVEGTVELLQEFSECIKAHRWIPVSERLPDHEDAVIVTVMGAREAFTAMDCYDLDFEAWECFSNDGEVRAWMPLPEPYKEGENNE